MSLKSLRNPLLRPDTLWPVSCAVVRVGRGPPGPAAASTCLGRNTVPGAGALHPSERLTIRKAARLTEQDSRNATRVC